MTIIYQPATAFDPPGDTRLAPQDRTPGAAAVFLPGRSISLDARTALIKMRHVTAEGALVDESQRETGRSMLAEMREAFGRRDWDATLALFEQIRPIQKGQKSLRVEATCLAARALIARNDRSQARSLLRRVAGSEYAKPAHYAFLAQAFLDLRNYKEAARLCGLADALLEAGKQEQSS